MRERRILPICPDLAQVGCCSRGYPQQALEPAGMIWRVQASGLRLGIGWGQSLIKPYLHLNKKAFIYF